ncbi:MAG: fructosamine kinase family protein [Pseudomonadota bacterium]|nr:fructosamine kinase family protein [Pseudomonadota bacterium]HJO34834.1 fructosamine kinase family protein [Gammaproteobacteria bacterium]
MNRPTIVALHGCGETLRHRLEDTLAAAGAAGQVRAQPLGGGDTGRAWRLTDPHHRQFFLKLIGPLAPAQAAAMGSAEADGLTALASCPVLRLPRVLGSGSDDATAFLLLEHVAMRPPAEADAPTLAAALISLHRRIWPAYGWRRDNFIGPTPQLNGWWADWGAFFAARRLAPLLGRLAGRDAALDAAGQRLLAALPRLLAGHHPPASLLHGDLWRGNVALDAQGRATLFDPAVHAGDRESDLAMMALFGGLEAVLAAYEARWPLPPGHERRRALYQSYHLLNHYLLFGAGYGRQARSAIERALGGDA